METSSHVNDTMSHGSKNVGFTHPISGLNPFQKKEAKEASGQRNCCNIYLYVYICTTRYYGAF